MRQEMIKATLIAATLVFGALALGAQTPPAPIAPAPPAQPAQPPEFEPFFGLEAFENSFEAFEMLEAVPTPDAFEMLEAMPPSEAFEAFERLEETLEAMPHLEAFEMLEAMPALAPTPSFDVFDGHILRFEDLPMEPLMPMEPLLPMEPMIPMEPMTPMAPMEPIGPMIALGNPDVMTAYTPHTPRPTPHSTPPTPHGRSFDQSHFDRQAGDLSSEPPQAWAQKDPADSLYRLARQTLNRGEYRRASQLFGDITQRFPNSAYAADARYWRAFALYRIGGVNELRDALASLNGDGRRYYQASLKADAATLASRIRGALAQLGDARAVTQVEREAGEQGVPCDKEDAAVRISALNSLGNLDHESATPILRRILAKRDSCSASLRRSALFLLAKRANPEATGLIITSARNDADPHVRSEALRWLARMPGDEAIATLEEIVRSPGDESMRMSAVAALARSESPRARQAIRNIIERSDVSESLRAKALGSIAKDESPDGGAYIRNVYPRLETTRLKLYAVRAAARIGGPENERWLLSIVRNQNEPLDLRTTALTYVGRSTIPIGDLVGMYEAAPDRPLRMRLISLYGSRAEAEAAEKLVAIAKTGTDPEMRRMAISALSRKNDPRTRKLLLEILDK